MLIEDDQRLSYEVERAIGGLPGVDLRDLRVTVTRGRARIVGVVPTYGDKRSAMEAAMAVPGILAVDEAIAVETPHPPTDTVLSEDLDEALDEEQLVDARRVGADAAGGQALLRGSARSISELGHAFDTAGEVPNTVNIIDSTRIENPYGTDQIDLANAVADALSRNRTLRNYGIRPVIEETGKVVLTGRVRFDEERTEALRIVSEVAGVHSVREELEIVP